jgi:CRISPR-associated protein Csm4
MSPLFRVKLKTTSPWRTPWQADTLAGALLATCARVFGADTLRSRLIDPMLADQPSFVLSDALPWDLLPFPIHLRLADWPKDTNLKAIKRARWLLPEHFQLARSGHRPAATDLLSDDQVFLDHTRQHNTLSRITDTSSASFDDESSSIGLYQKPEILLRSKERANALGELKPDPVLNGTDYLSLYFRLLDRSAADLLLDLLHQLSLSGFGADTSTGRGQFDLPDDPQPMPHLDQPPPNADGVVSLSTFQPGPADPTNGYWDAFPKFGKVGPDLGLADVRKNTLILFRPGACFRTDPKTLSLGHAVPMRKLLPVESSSALDTRNISIIHPAFAVTIPAALPEAEK